MEQLIGKPMDRVDGRLKVTGAVRYAADAAVQNVAHAVIVGSTIAKGRVQDIDTVAAEKVPGVLAVLTHKNMPKLKQPKEDFFGGGKMGEDRTPLRDDLVHYAGQHLAVVVADTLEAAREAAALVRMTYAVEGPLLEMDQAGATATEPKEFFGEEVQHRRGDVDAALAAADVVKVEQTYTTPVETHNPMEPSGTSAAWDGDRLTVHDATQWIMGTQAILAEALGLPRKNVHVVCPFVGGAFGCKGFIWGHTLLAAVAARTVGRPVKLVLTRPQMFTGVGHRPPTVQTVTLAATKDGRLTAIRHATTTCTSPITDHIEHCGAATSKILYACPNVHTPLKLLHLNFATPTPMRGPGESPGTFALESALDELACALGIDPVELRVRNHAEVNPANGKPWSSKHLLECYRLGAEKFGWKDRNPQPRSMRDGGLLVGWGMATATYPAYRFPGSARVRLLADGRAVVSSATHDLGTGAYTIFTQVAAQTLGLPFDQVRFELGDSDLPYAQVAGGSNTTATVSQAILEAAQAVKSQLLQLAAADAHSPLRGLGADQIAIAEGRLFAAADPARGEPYTDLLARAGRPALEATSSTQLGAQEQQRFAFQSFGAQFCEVKIDPQLPRVRVTRFVSAIDIGRVLNPKTCRSQVLGGVVMGLGMALMEHTAYDPRTGRPVTDNLADYAVPVNADVGSIEAYFLDRADPHINALGCRGVGEIGITGVAASVANAVFHATGKRVRDLPITPDKLLS